jgi:hypothetical protein
VERLIRIIEQACQAGSKVRLATLELSVKLLKQLVNKEDKSYLQDRHLACIENARECSTQRLRSIYKVSSRKVYCVSIAWSVHCTLVYTLLSSFKLCGI